ncbi:uncharacterized protein LOC143224875 isoform X9 [Tachypleus tridentatus]|uniref:uncharacterized protein LOC143224875 isoform X9 n=1 Tax=Tachypleus tridentatus TaxID=6853 RepID=UPI003FD0813D
MICKVVIWMTGIFVTRMRDCETLILLSGFLDAGDEILEVDRISVKERDIGEVNDLIIKKNKILSYFNPNGKTIKKCTKKFIDHR